MNNQIQFTFGDRSYQFVSVDALENFILEQTHIARNLEESLDLQIKAAKRKKLIASFRINLHINSREETPFEPEVALARYKKFKIDVEDVLTSCKTIIAILEEHIDGCKVTSNSLKEVQNLICHAIGLLNQVESAEANL